MAWWKVNQIPYNRNEFIGIMRDLLINCPVSTRHSKNIGKKPNGKTKKKYYYKHVSARGNSFKERQVTGNVLTTILAQIRRPMVINGTYAVLKNDESVELRIESILDSVSLSDPNYDVMVYHSRSDMPDTEAIYYYIRNAFAHGFFEALPINSGYVYLLESKKDEKIHARMRLNENTLLRIASFTKMEISEIKAFQK